MKTLNEIIEGAPVEKAIPAYLKFMGSSVSWNAALLLREAVSKIERLQKELKDNE